MKLRYVELPPDRIFNKLGPNNQPAWSQLHTLFKDVWWTPEVIKLRDQFAEFWVEEFDRITQHFKLLEQSILENGIQRPISVASGPLRDMYLKNPSDTISLFVPQDTPPNELIYTQPFGGSRVYLAQKLNINTIPCAIHDFSNLFPNQPEITKTNYRKWFGEEYCFVDQTPHLRIRTHSHIKNQKYKQFTSSTKTAQQNASQKARQRLEQEGLLNIVHGIQN